MSEWISVKDRFPEPEGGQPQFSVDVPVLDSYGEWFKGFYNYYSQEWVVNWRIADDVCWPITHWLELPTSPSLLPEDRCGGDGTYPIVK